MIFHLPKKKKSKIVDDRIAIYQMSYRIGMFAVTSQLGLVRRETTTDIPF